MTLFISHWFNKHLLDVFSAKYWDNNGPANIVSKSKALCQPPYMHYPVNPQDNANWLLFSLFYSWSPWSLVSLCNLLKVTVIVAERGLESRHLIGEPMSLTTLLEWEQPLRSIKHTNLLRHGCSPFPLLLARELRVPSGRVKAIISQYCQVRAIVVRM